MVLRGGRLPKTPKRCGGEGHPAAVHQTGELNPPPEPIAPPNLDLEECQADDQTPRCEYFPTGDGGIAGNGDPAAGR